MSDHWTAVPGGEIYYRTRDSGPLLVLIGGGPSNADSLTALAEQLASNRTVITLDRRGYSRSRLDDPAQPAPSSRHAEDVRQVIDDLAGGPASVFATSVGALIGSSSPSPTRARWRASSSTSHRSASSSPQTTVRPSPSNSTAATPASRSTRSLRASASTAADP